MMVIMYPILLVAVQVAVVMEVVIQNQQEVHQVETVPLTLEAVAEDMEFFLVEETLVELVDLE
jgi:hypothetical protein